jgi:peptide/nickel transport system substrate-binding protein
VARSLTVAVAVVASLLAVSGAGEAATPQTPKRGGTVVIAQSRHLEPSCLNPLFASCNSEFLDAVLLGAFQEAPGLTFRPELASAEAEKTKPFTLLYRIRPEARWSDGAPVTAGDFVFTQHVVLAHRADLSSEFLDHLDWIRAVSRVDAKTVRVVLRDRYPDWRSLFPWVLPRHVLAGQKLEGLWKDDLDDPRSGTPIGSGPFLVERFERGRQLVLRRNPRYWGPHHAYLDRIVVRYLAPDDAAEALRRGEVDMIDPGPAVLQSEALELRRQPEPGVKVLSAVDPAWEHFDIRMASGGHPALRNRLVRQALAYGIDRDAIARAAAGLTGATGVAVHALDSAVFTADSRYYEPNWKGYRYRPNRARQLLEQAGCRRGADGIYVCAGERLSLRFATVGGVARRQQTVELARDQLRAAGVEVVPVYSPVRVFFGTVIPSGDFDVALFGWITGALTAGSLDLFGCQRVNNFTGYCDRLVTRDLDRAAHTLTGRDGSSS